MKVTHYKPGDRVKTLKDFPAYNIKKGDVGTVTDPMIPSVMTAEDCVMVRFEGGGRCGYGTIRFSNTVSVRECDLVPADDPAKTDEKKTERGAERSIVFDLTENGGTAKYIVGGDTVRSVGIVLDPGEKQNDFNTMMYLIGDLFPESEMTVLRGMTGDADVPDDTDDEFVESMPVFGGYIPAHSYDGEPSYINIDRIESMTSVEEDDGSTTVLVYMTDGGRFEVLGATVGDVMEMIREARGW